MSEPLSIQDLEELGQWAASTLADAIGWAERAEVSPSNTKELTKHLDSLAAKSAHISALVTVLVGRKEEI